MRFFHRRFIELLILSLSVALVAVTASFGQISEFRFTRFAPAGTYAAASINVGSLLEKVDLDNPLLVKLKQTPALDSGFLEDPRLERAIFMVGSKAKLGRPAPYCYAWVFEMAEPLEPKAFFDQMGFAKITKVAGDTYKGQMIYVCDTQELGRAKQSADAWIFPEEHGAILARRHTLEQMIDGHDSVQEALSLVNRLKADADLHFVFRPNQKGFRGHWTELGFGTIVADLIQEARKVEVQINLSSQRPVQVEIEYPTEDDAKIFQQLWQLNKQTVMKSLDLMHEFDLPEGEERQTAVREFIQLIRVVVKKVKIEQERMTVRLTLDPFQGLDRLPQLALISWMILDSQAGP